MKVSTKLFACLLAPALLLGLSSCGPSADQTAAVEKIAGAAIVTADGSPLLAGTASEIFGDENTPLMMTVSQVTNINGNKMTVEIDWTYDASYQSLVAAFEVVEGDATHKMMTFNYPTMGAEIANFKFTANLKCGPAVATAQFEVNLNPVTHIWDKMTLAQLYARNSAGTNYAFIDETGTKIATNHGQDYYYVDVCGKLLYVSNDGNWGVIADGQYYIEIYAGSAYDLKPSSYPALVVGNYIEVRGNIGQYQGCPQIGFITRIQLMEDHSSIADPVPFGNVSEEQFNSWNQYDGLVHRYATYNDVVYNGNIKNKNSVAITASSIVLTERFTFEVKIGSTVAVIAFDYHTNNDGSSGSDPNVARAIRTILLASTAGTTHLKIDGTLRYVSTSTNYWDNTGSYQLTPITQTDVAVVGA